MTVMEDKDIVQEILFSLPPKSLGRCKSLSKDWYNFISYNPAFCKSYRSRNKGRCYLIMGIFFSKQLPYDENKGDVKFIHTCTKGKLVTEAATTLLIDGKLSFLDHHNINVLASSNGALLASTQLKRPVNYFICSPITTQYITLPTTKLYGDAPFCTHGFICRFSYPYFEKGIEYKVVRSACFWLQFCTTVDFSIFSSDEWKIVVWNIETPLYLYQHFNTIISEEGIIYMPGVRKSQNSMCLVIVDESKASAELETLPVEEENGEVQKLSQYNQLILYASYNCTRIKIWVLNERNGGTRQWSLKHMLGSEILRLIHPLNTVENWRSLVQVNAFHPINPNIVFCYTYPPYVYCKNVSYDFDNLRWELVCDHEDKRWKFLYNSFPYTCDAVFAPHLFFDS